MTNLTPERRKELMALCEAATPGPWFVDEDWRASGAHQVLWISNGFPLTVCFMATSEEGEDSKNERAFQDTKLISAAREALPLYEDALVASQRECIAYQGENSSLRRQLAEAERRIAEFEKAFRHLHSGQHLLGVGEVGTSEGDICSVCGLDLRNRIHQEQP